MAQFSLNAFNAAPDIAKKYDAKFSVLTCLAKENISAWYVNKEMHAQIIENAKKFATSFIPKLEDYVKNTGVSQSVSVIETKSISKEIIDFTTLKKINLIIKDSIDVQDLPKYYLGIVSYFVVRLDKYPVLVIK